jgi:SAM-dependent methyltransferase
MTYPAADRLKDLDGRKRRARRICKIVETFSPLKLADSIVLDIGASHLLMADELATTGAQVVGIDVDLDAMVQGTGSSASNVAAVVASGEALPFKDQTFDLVICNHVYEHVHDAEALVSEIRRVLRQDGVCYFAGGHKYQLIEPHYRIPFLSWIPVRWADKWLKMRGWEGYDIAFLDLPDLHALLASFQASHNITTQLLSRADEFDLAPKWMARFFKTVPSPIRNLLSRLSPTQIWLLHP